MIGRRYVIHRRDVVNGLVLSLLGCPVMSAAQPAQKMPVVGILSSAVRGSAYRDFVDGLSRAGYVEGKNINFETRFVEGNPAAFPGFAAELVKHGVDVIYGVGPAAVKAARDSTQTIPIVALDLETDPVRAGWASSIARPGGNVTGLFLDIPALAGKWIELLRAAAPDLRRLGLLWDSNSGSAQLDAARAVATRMRIEVQVLEWRRTDGIEAALKAGVLAGIGALVMLGSPVLGGAHTARMIAEFAVRNRWPAISPFRTFADSGGLMSYGPDLKDLQPAGFVARILRGEKPRDMAIQLPSKFELVVNLNSAKAIGLTIPRALLLVADQVIQ